MYYPNYITRSAAIIAAISSLALLQDAKAIIFNSSTVPGSGIRFTGLPAGHAEITFDLGFSGHMFQIDDVDGGSGSAVGYEGNFTGIFDMGPVTVVNPVPLVESAPVTGIGTFSISDGVDTLTGTLSWTQAASLQRTASGPSELGLRGELSGMNYTGTDSDLLAFAGGNETAFLSFTFPLPGKTLAQLTDPGSEVTTFSGAVGRFPVGVPDSGTTLTLLSLGLLGLSLVRRRSTIR